MTWNTTRANPFNLTNRQCEVMDALTKRGTIKGVASELDISVSTAEGHIAAACKKFGASIVRAAVEWDRLNRNAPPPKPKAVPAPKPAPPPPPRRVASVWELAREAA
jgi:DNA-binding CsgD family transcriptional regulator